MWSGRLRLLDSRTSEKWQAEAPAPLSPGFSSLVMCGCGCFLIAIAIAGVVYCLIHGLWVVAVLIIVVPAAIAWFGRKALG
jgi:hypothetical protein